MKNAAPHIPRAIRAMVCLLSFLAMAMVFGSLRAATPEHKGFTIHPTRILVQLKQGQVITTGALNSALDKAGTRIADRYQSFPGLLLLDSGDRHPGLKALRKKNHAPVRQTNLEERLSTLRKSGLFEFVEPDYIRKASLTPTDSAFADGRLFGLHNTGQSGGTTGADVNATSAWNVTTGSRDVIVAVIDTGIRYTHHDLAANMWRNADEIPGNGVDDDQDGYVDNIHGINAVAEEFGAGNPMDSNGHGTHVAGTIGAAANNGHPHVGVAWEVSLMALKFLNGDGEGKTSDEIKCIDFAISNGAQIINASYGGPGFSQAQKAAMRRAEAAGILFVAAAGNEASNNDQLPGYPASFDFPNVISVASLNRHNQLSDFSNIGINSVDIAAPGESIFSCWIDSDSDYKVISGTSMAAPHVAGVAALVLSRFPNIGIPELRGLLLNTATPVTPLAGQLATGGRINAYAAVNAVADGELETNITPAPGGELLAGTTVRFAIRVTDLTDVTDATITGTINRTPAPAFLNDGSGSDQTANDAIYTAEMVVPSFDSNLTLELTITAPGKATLQKSLTYSIAVPAPNNDFAKASIIEGIPISATGSNHPADLENGEPRHADVDGGNSVWWTWIAPDSGPVVVDTEGSDYDTVLAVYTGVTVDALTEVAANDDISSRRTTSRVTFEAVAGTAYSIAVDGFGGRTGNITLSVQSSNGTSAAPVNDNFANATSVDGSDVTATADSSNATKETGEPNHAENPGGRSVWFTWQSPADGILEASTTGSNFDTLLAIYQGTSVASLSVIAENDDGPVGDLSSHLLTTVASNTVYHIAVDGFNGAGGPANLTLQLDTGGSGIENDAFAQAATIPALPVTITASNTAATKEADEPDHAGNMGGHSLWWEYTADSNRLVTVDLEGSDFDTLLAVYTGSSLSNLTLLVANDDSGFDSLTSRATFMAASGTSYFIVVDGYAGPDRIGDRGNIKMNVEEFMNAPPINDNFANRSVINLLEFAAAGTSTGAAIEAGEPVKAYNSGGASLWWSYTPTQDQLLEVTTLDSEFDTILSVYTGGSLNTLAEVANNDEEGSGQTPFSTLTFVAKAGTEYHIALDGFNGQAGNYRLQVRQLGLATSVQFSDFNSSAGYSAGQALGGQQGWLAIGDGRNEVISSGFVNDGQAAIIGGAVGQSTNQTSHAFVWRTFNGTPPSGKVVRFSTRMAINDSTNRIFDSFSWQFFNNNTEPLFGLHFDNANLLINYLLDNDSENPTGFTFPNNEPFHLSVVINLENNFWVAWINDTPIVSGAPITLTGAQLTLGEIDAAWHINQSGIPGDNHLVFDNYAVDHIQLTLPPTIEHLSPTTNILEGGTLDLFITASGPGTLAYQWYHEDAPIPGATQTNLSITPVTATNAGKYTVAVSNEWGGQLSDPIYVFVAAPVAPAPNDHFTNALLIVDLPHFCRASNEGASTEPNEPQHAGKVGGSSLWWKWTATTNTMVTLSTLGSSFDTIVGVYQGASVDNLTELESNDDLQRRRRGSLLRFQAMAGQTYFIAVDGYNGATGNIRFWLNARIDTRFRRPIRHQNGTVDLDVETEAGITYLLQASGDLIHWTTIGTITGGTNGVQFQDLGSTQSGSRFYRLLLEP